MYKESLGWKLLAYLENGKIWLKMVDFQNHRKLTLRCIKVAITPVSCRLRNSVRTPKSYQLIKKVEKQLLNESVRSINQTLYQHELKRKACYTRLKNFI